MDDPALFMPHLEFTQNLGLTRYNILGFLLGKGLATFVLNPLHTNLFRKSTSLRRTKTDRVDARTMAPRSNPQDSTVGGRAATWKPLGFPTLQL